LGALERGIQWNGEIKLGIFKKEFNQGLTLRKNWGINLPSFSKGIGNNPRAFGWGIWKEP